MKLTRWIATLVYSLVIAIGMAIAPASAADCPHGALDERFCDANGDLVADAPSDASAQIDPGTLIFAYTPVEDPAVYKTAWADFLTHLEKETGKKVQFFPGTIQCRADRGHALRAPAHRRLQHRLQSAGRELRRLRALHDHGWARRQLRLRDGDHHPSE